MTSPALPGPVATPRVIVRPPRRVAVRAKLAALPWWAMAGAILAVALIYHTSTDPGTRFQAKTSGKDNFGPAWFDQQKYGPFTPADVLTFGFAYLALIYRFTREGFHVSRTAVRMWFLIGVPIALGVVVGIEHGTKSPFGDWRDMFVGALFAIGLWSTVLTSEEGCFRFAQLFAGMVGAYGFVQLVQYATGGGEIAFYGRTPTGDHATLEYMVAAVGVSLAMLRTRRTPALWWMTIAVGTMVVVLAFRRYAWVEIGTVFAVFLLLSGKNRMKYIVGVLGVTCAAVIAITLLGSTLDWGARVASLNPWANKQTNALAATNQGHLNEVLDGMDQIRAHPLVGLGVGKTYVGKRTARWKGDAGMVHNGPIEMWIKFTVLGFFAFFAVYFILFRAVWRRRHGTNYSDLLAWGAGSFLLGQFFVTATVYAWPFGVWEKSILEFTCVAMIFCRHVDEAKPAPEEEVV